MSSKTIKTILFASLIVAMIMPFSSTDMAFATPADAKIKEFKQKALRDNEVPSDELLKRVGDKWLSSYKDEPHFDLSEEAVNKFVERNNVKDGLDKENSKLISKIHNFETITESVGDGHEIVLLIAQLEKTKGQYNPSDAVSKYHSWIEEQYTVPTTNHGVKDRLTEILGDKKFVNLAKKQANYFNELAEIGSVPIELFTSDEGYWGEVKHIASCERDVKCDVDVLKHQPGATQEEIDRILQIEAELNEVSFDLWDIVLPQAYAWSKTQVSYDLRAYINLGACYYQNCYEEWNISTSGSDSIDHSSYDSPSEHVYRNYSMYFYGRACDTYSGSQTVISEVTTTPYLATALKTNLSDNDLNYNSCVYANHYDSSSSHDWIVGILVESPGSYYWVR